MLNFLGRGSGFYPHEGNTSAYIVEDNTMFLIDCGETIFKTIIENNILDDIDNINLLITHTHSDHIGSLGSLILYCYYAIHKPLNILTDENMKHLDNVINFLLAMGISDKIYRISSTKSLDNKFKSFNSIRYIPAEHCKELSCSSIIINTNSGLIYYSGDSNNASYIKYIIESGSLINSIYVDVTNEDYLKTIHLDLNILAETVPLSLRDKVYCMHFNNSDCIRQAKELGFNVVEVIDRQKSLKKE